LIQKRYFSFPFFFANCHVFCFVVFHHIDQIRWGIAPAATTEIPRNSILQFEPSFRGIRANIKSEMSDPHSIPLLSSPQDDEEQQQSTGGQPPYTSSRPQKRPLLNRYSWVVAAVLLVIFIGLLAVPKPDRQSGDIDDDYDDDSPVPDSSGICKQHAFVRLPDDDISKALEKVLNSEDYRKESANRLTGAVQIATESFDDMGPVGDDQRWDIFQDFHDYLEKSYPKMYISYSIGIDKPSYSTLRVEKVNTWGLVYTWNGSDTDLKPSCYG
jgi:hypothetical protein